MVVTEGPYFQTEVIECPYLKIGVIQYVFGFRFRQVPYLKIGVIQYVFGIGKSASPLFENRGNSIRFRFGNSAIGLLKI